jgi:uncharacterized membrane protein YfcA
VTESLLLAGGGAVAGMFGALLGLGGGVLVVPVLTLVFGLDFREAVGISLVGVIATSSAGAAVYLRRRVADLRLSLTFEVVSVIGAIAGGLVAFALSERILAALFGVLLAYNAVAMLRRAASGAAARASDAWVAPVDDLAGRGYTVRRRPLGLALGALSGVISALLGIGGGAVNVPALHVVMGVPLRVAVATSNVMMGVTAAASATLYVFRGAVDPFVAGPVVVGVFLGAGFASRVSERVPVQLLRALFVLVLGYLAVEMAARAAGITLLGHRGV